MEFLSRNTIVAVYIYTCIGGMLLNVDFCSSLYNRKRLMSVPSGNSFVFPRISMFPSTSSRGTD
jgi:hypothetical protein